MSVLAHYRVFDDSAETIAERDRLWVDRAQQGDRAAFEAIFQTYYAGICDYIYRIVAARDIAEELAADVFLDFWKRKEQPPLQSPLRAWLLTTARHRTLSFLRRRQLEQKWLERSALDLPEPDQPIAEQEVVGEEFDVIVLRAIAELPPRRGEVFALHWQYGLTYAEIGQVLGISVKTVEAQMGKALRALRTLLAPYLR